MRRLELLDYARLAAALSVVAFHWLYLDARPFASVVPLAKYGYLGVELFFIMALRNNLLK